MLEYRAPVVEGQPAFFRMRLGPVEPSAWLILVLAVGLLGLIDSASAAPAPARKSGVRVAQATTEAVNESPRERNRILLKRNPIASEYQVKGSFGRSPGAAADAESVDFRSFFRMPESGQRAELALSSSRQNESGAYQPGGSLNLAGAIGGSDSPWHGALRISRNAVDRIIDEYGGRWNVRSDADNVPALAFSRYTRDYLETATNQLSYRLGFTPSDQWQFSYQGALTDFEDLNDRNRLEFQFARGAVVPGSLQFTGDNRSLAGADFTGGSIRRYFQYIETQRRVSRHQLAMKFESADRVVEADAFVGKWDNFRDWDGWNFLQNGVNMAYRTGDPFEPALVTDPGFDVFDVQAPGFANLRFYDISTIDRDRALRLNYEQRFTWGGHDGWWSAGALWRTKARDNDQQRLVFVGGDSAPALGDFTLRRDTDTILDGDYLLPAELAAQSSALTALAAEGAGVQFDPALSFSESAQEQFKSEETVGAIYLAAYQQIDRWRWKAGLRLEQTETETVGSVVAPPDFVANTAGIPIQTLRVQGRTLTDSFVNFDAKRVPGSGSYRNWLPSFELEYRATDRLTLTATQYQSLMRPQYFDIVEYRRVILPISRIQEGNPDLAATTIDSLALAMEYRHPAFGTLSAEWYQKSVSDFFYNAISNELLDGVLFDVNRVENGRDGEIQGFQLAWDVSREKPLPGLDRVQFETAYTYSESFANIADASGASRKISMPERSRHFLSGTLRLARGPWNASVTGSYQSRSLDNVGNAAGRDRFRMRFVQVGANLSRSFADSWNVALAVSNLTNQPERSFDGESRRVLLNQYSFVTSNLTITRTL